MRRTQTLLVAMALLGCTTASEDAITTTSTSAEPTEATQSAPTTAATTTTTEAATTTTTQATTTTEAIVLDFSQIAGRWTGTGVDGFEEFSIEAEIKPSVELNGFVGTVEYVGELAISQEPCQGLWLARAAEPPVYEIKESVRSGPCPPGEVILRYDPGTDIVDYEFIVDQPPALTSAADATGTLTRVEN